jgi:hypothetical protein
MKRRSLLLCSFALMIAASALPAAAIPRLSAGGGCSPVVGGNLGAVPGLDCSAGQELRPAPPGAVAQSGRVWIDARPGTANSAGFQAAAGFGLLQTSSYANVSTAPPLGTATPLALGVAGSGFALAIDDVTFTAAGLTGQAGIVNGSVLVDGALSVSTTDATVGNARASWEFTAQFIVDGQIKSSTGASGILQVGSAGLSGQPAVSRIVPFSIPLVFGQTGQLLLQLNTSAAGVARPAGSPGTPGYLLPVVSGASSLFSNTVTWQGVESVTLADGTPVDAWSVSSASGVDYALPIPEPASALLSLVGLFGLAVRSRRRGSRARAGRPRGEAAARPEP